MGEAETEQLAEGRPRRADSRAGEVAQLLRRIPVALGVLIATAIALRLALSLTYRPTVMNFADVVAYVDMARDQMFVDPYRPAGYSMFLRAVHYVAVDLDATIALQHLLGIATGIVMYATVMRLGAPRWTALAAGAAIWLSLDQVLAEHTLVSESLFTFAIVCVLYASVRALEEPRRIAGPLSSRHLWILAAGAGLGGSAWIRGVAAALIPFFVLWLATAIPGELRDRAGRAVMGGFAAVVALLIYFSLHAASEGHFTLTRTTGWALYGRVAPFADCDQFEPPDGTAALCEQQSSDPPGGYVFDRNSPARRLFGHPPNGDSKLQDFALEVIRHQPLPYLQVVFNDTVRYFAPGYHLGDPGTPYVSAAISLRAPEVEQDVQTLLSSYYLDTELAVDETAATILTDLQQILRVHAVLMLQALILGVIGIIFSSGRLRAGLALFLGAAVLMLVVPSATAVWTPRYALPAAGPFVAAGTIGLWLLVRSRQVTGLGAPDSPREPD